METVSMKRLVGGRLQCELCEGEGSVVSSHARMADGSSRFGLPLPCPECDGEGTISPERSARAVRGEQLRKERLQAGFGLRRAAFLRGMKPSELSDQETGRAEPRPFDYSLLGRDPH